jgi:20S proteasome alpha/beta subunit
MTYILGVNCTDGVVLIGDRKIIYNDTVDWQQKMFGLPVENIIL